MRGEHLLSWRRARNPPDRMFDSFLVIFSVLPRVELVHERCIFASPSHYLGPDWSFLKVRSFLTFSSFPWEFVLLCMSLLYKNVDLFGGKKKKKKKKKYSALIPLLPLKNKKK
eukprot:TRINITY_DN12026_c0_g2_i6.p1 TRINITY_DN12026_c0_g2~~TRINITY_DN12026_c0_g2_i6.p1  ORF type:complete len:113 (-),score=10.13 TRINITY_DN12026_c0_g2_i6:1-339(-)